MIKFPDFFNPDTVPKKVTVHLVLVCVFLSMFGYRYSQRDTKQWHLNSDPEVYMVMGLNLYRHSVFSADQPDASQVEPTAYRLPVYPGFLALCMALSTDMTVDIRSRSIFVNHFIGGRIQTLLTIITAILSMTIVFLLTRSWVSAYVTLFIVGLDNAMRTISYSILPEVLVAFLITGFSLSFLLSIKKNTIWVSALSGLLLGVLSLTRGQFQYFILLGLGIFIWKMVIDSNQRKKRLVCLCLFVMIPLSIVSIWKARNYFNLGRFYLTDRGGLVLDARANYNMMSSQEYMASFIFYLERNQGPDLRKYFPGLDKSSYARLNPGIKNPLSLEVKARGRRNELIEQYGSYSIADAVQLREALDKIKSHPVRHLLACLPYGFRGTFAKKGLRGPILFAMFFGIIFWAFIKRREDVLIGLAAALFSFGFTTFVSLNEPRFNIPLIPMLYVASLIVIHQVISDIYRRMNRKT